MKSYHNTTKSDRIITIATVLDSTCKDITNSNVWSMKALAERCQALLSRPEGHRAMNFSGGKDHGTKPSKGKWNLTGPNISVFSAVRWFKWFFVVPKNTC
jgi:hypothetical protein